MMEKPEECCEVGTYEHTVPMTIRGLRRNVDLCIADLVAALNAANITTDASCCGHGKMNGNVALHDRRVLEIHPSYEAWSEHRKEHEALGRGSDE